MAATFYIDRTDVVVRKARVGWWVNGLWCPTAKVRDHQIAKLGGEPVNDGELSADCYECAHDALVFAAEDFIETHYAGTYRAERQALARLRTAAAELPVWEYSDTEPSTTP